jgi:dihydrodipicolinate synthase/N-acetylneuraminate lyase
MSSSNLAGDHVARRRTYRANTPAPTGTFAIPPGSAVGGRGVAKYPINTLPRARNALARVAQHGTPAEVRMVHAAVRRKWPALAQRSTVVATRTGTGRRHGQPKGATNRGRR